MVSVDLKKPTCSLPSFGSFFDIALKRFQYLSDWGWPFLFPFKEDNQALPLFAHLLQAIDGAMSVALRLQVVSQAPQHFRSPEMQALCDGCFARLSVSLVIFNNDYYYYYYYYFPSCQHLFDVVCWMLCLPVPCCYFTWRCALLFQSMEQGPLKNSDVLILTCLTQTPLAMPDPMIGEFCHNSGG